MKQLSHKSWMALLLSVILFTLLSFTVFAAETNTDVAGTVTTAFGTYMQPQIKDITNNVILPIIDGIVLIALIAKSVMAWSNYRKNGGQYEWHTLAVLAGCLVIGITSPLWMWSLIGW